MLSTRSTPNGTRSVGILGVPLGYGAAKIGSELGVNAIRLSQSQGRTLHDNIAQLGYDVYDHGDVRVTKPQFTAGLYENPKYLAEMTSSSQAIYDSVTAILEKDQRPIILGGDHSIAIGTFSALSAFHRARGEEIGLIWFDAHAESEVDIKAYRLSSLEDVTGPLANTYGWVIKTPSLTRDAASSSTIFCSRSACSTLSTSESRLAVNR